MLQVILDLGRVELFGGSITLRIFGYGLMLVLGFLTGIYLARWRARRFGENPDAAATLGLVSLAGGVAGARVAYVIEQWDLQFRDAPDRLTKIFDITSGGLIYYGGVALAIAMVVIYLLLRRLPMRRFLDIVAPALMIGLAFGRMGCLLNGCCYGGRVRDDFSFGMRFGYASRPLVMLDGDANMFGGASVSPAFADQVARLPSEGGMDLADLPAWLPLRDAQGNLARYSKGPYAGRPMPRSPDELTDEQAAEAVHLHTLPLQPAQPLGIINALLIAGLLMWFSRIRRREGQVFLLMLILYPITRFVLEVIRGDNPHDLLAGQLTHNQYVSIIIVMLALIAWYALRRLPASAGPAWAGRVAANPTRRPTALDKRTGRKRGRS